MSIGGPYEVLPSHARAAALESASAVVAPVARRGTSVP